jgi:hypothetical protein
MFFTTGPLSSVLFGTEAENWSLANIVSQEKWMIIAVGWGLATVMGVLAIVSILIIDHLRTVVLLGLLRSLFVALAMAPALLEIVGIVSTEDLATLVATAVCVTTLCIIGQVRDARVFIMVLNLVETNAVHQTRAITIVVGWELAIRPVFIVFARTPITVSPLKDVLFITKLFRVTQPLLRQAVQPFLITLLTPRLDHQMVPLIRKTILMLGLIGLLRLLLSLWLVLSLTFTNLKPGATPWPSPTSQIYLQLPPISSILMKKMVRV